jgi:hypothetical protein
MPALITLLRHESQLPLHTHPDVAYFSMCPCCIPVTQARVTALESALAAAEREAATAQNAAAWRKDTEAESAVAATERAGRAEAALAKADAECGQLRARVSHLEHTLRSRWVSGCVTVHEQGGHLLR